MARLIGPDAGSRLVYVLSGSLLRSAAGYTATIYSDAAGTILADIALYQPLIPGTPGAVIVGSTVLVNSNSQLPLFWFPLSGQDTLYARVGGVSSPVVAINADYDARIDLLIAASGVLSVNGDIGPAVLLTSVNTPPASIGAAATVHVHAGEDVTAGTVATARLDTGVAGTQVALGNHTHPSTGGVATSSGYIVAGDQILTNVGSTWTVVPGLGGLTIPAVVGDRIEIQFSFLARMLGTNFLDSCVTVGGVIQRAASNGTATPAVEGDPTAYRDAGDNEVRGTGPFFFTAASGDLSGGNVTFGLFFKGTGTTSVVYNSANYPFRWVAKNYGP
jgi:hypothetical protein